MTQLVIGYKPGFGPVVAVLRNDNDDFTQVPVTDYSKFFLSTEGQDLSYMFDKYHFTNGFNASIYDPGSSSTQGNTYSLDGNPVATCKRGISVVPVQFSSTQLYWNYNEIFPRFPNLGGVIPVFEVKLIDANDRVDLFRFDGAPGNTRLYSTGFLYSGVTNEVTPSSGTPIHANVPYDMIHPSFNYSGWVGKASNAPTPLSSVVVLNRGDNRRFLSCQWDLPANNAPLPYPNNTPVVGQEVVSISPAGFKVARRGETTNSSNPRSFLINSDKAPMMCIMMDETPIIPAGGSVYRPNKAPFSLHPTMFLDAIMRYSGMEYSIPPVDPTVSRSGKECRFFYKIDANGITFYNEGDYAVGCKYMIYATSIEGNTSGGVDIIRKVEGEFIQIKRPGSSDTAPSVNEVMLDTRFPSVRILKEGWIPISAFSTGNSLNNLYGTHAAVVPFENHPGMFIFPKVIGNWPKMMAQGYYRSLRPPSVVQWRTSNYCMTTVVEANRMVVHLSPGAPTDVRADSGFQYSMPDPIGVRYYVFGATQI